MDVMSNTMLYVAITEDTFSLRTTALTNILSFEYIVNTPWFAALYTLQLYIFQPHFTFYNILHFFNFTFRKPTLHFAALYILQLYILQPTLHLAALYILQLYILQPHFTFCSTLHFATPLYMLQRFMFCGPTL